MSKSCMPSPGAALSQAEVMAKLSLFPIHLLAPPHHGVVVVESRSQQAAPSSPVA